VGHGAFGKWQPRTRLAVGPGLLPGRIRSSSPSGSPSGNGVTSAPCHN